MAELVRRFPDRFVGFAAALPLGDVEASLTEIDRAVGDLGALGAQMFSNVRGTPLDDSRFDPILTRMEALERMIWLHPNRDAAWLSGRSSVPGAGIGYQRRSGSASPGRQRFNSRRRHSPPRSWPTSANSVSPVWSMTPDDRKS